MGGTSFQPQMPLASHAHPGHSCPLPPVIHASRPHMPPSAVRLASGRYASYWNGVLFEMFLVTITDSLQNQRIESSDVSSDDTTVIAHDSKLF